MADRRRRRDEPQEGVDPAEFTRRMPDDDQEGAGPGAPETVEPTQGREGTGPGGPAMKGIGEDDEPDEDRT
jgi:hypothetical protein